MKTWAPKCLLVSMALAAALFGCGSTGKDGNTSWLTCGSNVDCPDGMQCSRGLCASGRAGAQAHRHDAASVLDASDGRAPGSQADSGRAANPGDGGIDAAGSGPDALAPDGAVAPPESGTSTGGDASLEGGSTMTLDGGRISCPVGSIDQGGSCAATHADGLDTGFVQCRVKSDGTLWCWGAVGAYPSWQQAWYPQQVGTASDWKTVSVGLDGICGLKQSGTVWCFGRLDTGTGPYGGSEDQNAPTQVGSDSDWRSVSAGGEVSCGVKNDGSLWCWGALSLYVPGDAGFSLAPSRVDADSDFASVTVGPASVCAIKNDGALYCFGYNASDPTGLAQSRSLLIRANVVDGSSAVPEPGTVGLAGLAMLLLAGLRGKRASA